MSDLTHHADSVRVMLLKSEETEGIIDVLREGSDPPQIVDRGTYWLVNGEGEISLDAAAVGDRLGRDFDVDDILVNFASYAGRVEISETVIRVTAEILGLSSAPAAQD